MEVIVRQQIYYSNKEWIPAGEIASSLLALEELIKSSSEVIEKIFPGVIVERVDVYVNELRSDSLWEDLVVKFVFGSQDNFDEQISGFRKKIGMEYLDRHPNVLGVIIGAMILGSAIVIYDAVSGKESERAVIEANNNIIINIGAGEVDIDSEDLKEIISGVIKSNPSITDAAVEVVSPARKDPNARIVINEQEELTITPKAIEAMPKVKPQEEEHEVVEDFQEITLEIRATDLDSTKRGWAVVPVDLTDKRIRLHLDPTINIEALLERRTITGSATVVFIQKGDKKEPKLVFLRSIQEEIEN